MKFNIGRERRIAQNVKRASRECVARDAMIKMSYRDKYIHQVKRCYSGKHRGGRDIWPSPVAIMETLLEEPTGAGGEAGGELEERERERDRWKGRGSR